MSHTHSEPNNIPPLAANHYFDVPTCAICGCTEERPCVDEFSCYWVTMNTETKFGLCSACVGF